MDGRRYYHREALVLSGEGAGASAVAQVGRLVIPGTPGDASAGVSVASLLALFNPGKEELLAKTAATAPGAGWITLRPNGSAPRAIPCARRARRRPLVR